MSDSDLTVFRDEYLPNVQGSDLYKSWAKANKDEVARWSSYRDEILAGRSPVEPTMKTAFGRSLVDAGQLAKQDAPVVGTLGKLLMDAWPEPAKPTGPAVRCKTWADCEAALSSQVSADYFMDPGVKIGIPKGDWFFRYKGTPGVNARYRWTFEGGPGRLIVAKDASDIVFGDTLERPFVVRGGLEDGLKFDGGIRIFVDGLITEDNGASGIQTGSTSLAPVRRLRLINWITRRNGHNDNKDHGGYLDHLDEFLLANVIADQNMAYALQLYTSATRGIVVNYTLNGGTTRGGIVVGTEQGMPDQTQDIRFVGGIITKVPSTVSAAHVNVAAPNCRFEDTVLWKNAGGDIQGLPNVRPVTADPLLDANLKPAKGSSAKGIVRDSGWVYPTDINGVTRATSDAGAVAVAA